MAAANRLIIGLDYGTTFSGVAFQAVTGGIPRDFHLVMDWSDHGNAEKVPSEISYSLSPSDKCQWGYSFHDQSIKLTWTKLQLDQQEKVEELDLILKALIRTKNLDFGEIQQAQEPLFHLTWEPEDIIADYLAHVREKLWANLLQEFTPVLLSSVHVDLVITVPATWTESARNKTFRSVYKAGFDTSHFPGLKRYIMITEQEACFRSLIRGLQPLFGQVSMLPGESFVVCDAGGGTVDLLSYRIQQINPTFESEAITVCTGHKCGATFIDKNFRLWLERKLGTAMFKEITDISTFNEIGWHNIVEPKMARLMKDFIQIKQNFRGIGHPAEEFIQLPSPLNNLNEPAKGINSGEIRITDHEIREMFRFSVNKTIDLIKGQINLVRQAGSTVRYVFLSGGFAASQYLCDEIRMFLRMQNIRLEVAEHAWSAVVRGAVARGIDFDESKVVIVRKCPRHYGVAVSQIFSRFKHSDIDADDNPLDGQKKAKEQMIWLVKKGDGIFSDQRNHPSVNIRRKFSSNGPKIFRTTLVSCLEEVAPDRLADVPTATREIAIINYSFDETKADSIQSGPSHFITIFKIELRLKQAEMEFVVSCRGNDPKTVAVQYQFTTITKFLRIK